MPVSDLDSAHFQMEKASPEISDQSHKSHNTTGQVCASWFLVDGSAALVTGSKDPEYLAGSILAHL